MINLDLDVLAYCSEDLFDDVRQYVNLAAVTKKVNPQTLENLVEDVNKLITRNAVFGTGNTLVTKQNGVKTERI